MDIVQLLNDVWGDSAYDGESMYNSLFAKGCRIPSFAYPVGFSPQLVGGRFADRRVLMGHKASLVETQYGWDLGPIHQVSQSCCYGSRESRKRIKKNRSLRLGGVGQIAHKAVATGDFELIGAVDDERVGQGFFGYEIICLSTLAAGLLSGTHIDTLVLVA